MFQTFLRFVPVLWETEMNEAGSLCPEGLIRCGVGRLRMEFIPPPPELAEGCPPNIPPPTPAMGQGCLYTGTGWADGLETRKAAWVEDRMPPLLKITACLCT